MHHQLLRLTLLVPLALGACRPQPIVIQTNEPHPASPLASGEAEIASHSLSVQGLATLEVIPDRLDLRVHLRQNERRPDRAIAAIRKRQSSLEEAINAAGLAKVERSIGRLSLSEHFERQENENVKVGYTASIMITISLVDFDRVGEFMQLASENGAESMNTQFRCTKLSDMKMQVRANAVQAAKAKAEQLSSLSGVKLGAVIGLSESDHREAYWGQSAVANSYTPAAANSALQLGDSQELSINVNIVYRLLPG